MFFYFSLIILSLAFGALLFGKDSQKASFYKIIFIFSILVIFCLLFYISYQQYQLWSQGDYNEISKYLLPPYQSVNYFIFYALIRFFNPYLISLAAGILFLFSAKILNKKYEERFFYPEEFYLGGLAIFLVGHPGWLFYIVFLLIIYLLIHLFSSLVIRSSSFRISLYYLWLPAAIFVIIIGKWLEILPIWQILNI